MHRCSRNFETSSLDKLWSALFPPLYRLFFHLGHCFPKEIKISNFYIRQKPIIWWKESRVHHAYFPFCPQHSTQSIRQRPTNVPQTQLSTTVTRSQHARLHIRNFYPQLISSGTRQDTRSIRQHWSHKCCVTRSTSVMRSEKMHICTCTQPGNFFPQLIMQRVTRSTRTTTLSHTHFLDASHL